MNKFLIFASALLLTAAVSAQPKPFHPDIYVGLQGGIGYDGLPNHNLKGINFGGRAFAGYNFTQHFAIESGILLTDSREVKDILPNKLTTKIKFKQQILDLSGRINIPLDYKFTVYGKAGMACMDYFEHGMVNKNLNLTYGFGLDYNVAKGLNLGIMWQHYNGGSKKLVDLIYKKYQPSLDFYGISLTYNF